MRRTDPARVRPLTGLDLERPARFTVWRTAVVVAGALAVLLAWIQVDRAADGLEISRDLVGDLPVTLLVPDGAVHAPAVVVVHGFAGSSALMRSVGLAFGQAGYVVALPDLSGHGANRSPLTTDVDLGGEVLSVADHLRRRPEVDRTRVSLVGHSMGSGAVLDAAVRRPDAVDSVVAMSPTDAEVSPDRPPHLLLLAGAREPRFVANARDLLERAGGPTEADEGVQARAFVEIPRVDHVSVLFSPVAHGAAVDWVDRHGGVDRVAPGPPAAPRTPPLLLWWIVALVGALSAWRAAAPVLVSGSRIRPPRGRPVVGLVVSGVVATLVLTMLDAFLALDAIGGMLVAPVLVAWFLVAGGVWLRLGPRPGEPDGRDPVWGLVLLGLLVVSFGLLAARVWLPWLPLGPRAWLAGAFSAGLFPWALAYASAVHGRRGPAALGWWSMVSVTLLLTLGAAAGTVESLGFLAVLLPTLPLVLGFTLLVTSPVQRPWAVAVATAGFLGWLVAVVFPLA